MSTNPIESSFEYRYYRLMLCDMIKHTSNERIILNNYILYIFCLLTHTNQSQ